MATARMWSSVRHVSTRGASAAGCAVEGGEYRRAGAGSSSRPSSTAMSRRSAKRSSMRAVPFAVREVGVRVGDAAAQPRPRALPPGVAGGQGAAHRYGVAGSAGPQQYEQQQEREGRLARSRRAQRHQTAAREAAGGADQLVRGAGPAGHRGAHQRTVSATSGIRQSDHTTGSARGRTTAVGRPLPPIGAAPRVPVPLWLPRPVRPWHAVPGRRRAPPRPPGCRTCRWPGPGRGSPPRPARRPPASVPRTGRRRRRRTAPRRQAIAVPHPGSGRGRPRSLRSVRTCARRSVRARCQWWVRR